MGHRGRRARGLSAVGEGVGLGALSPFFAAALGWAQGSAASTSRCCRAAMGTHGGEAVIHPNPRRRRMSWYWHRVVPLLEQAGYEAIAVDLPADDSSKGLNGYADVVIREIGPRSKVILVAQSPGGFTAPLVCARKAVRGLLLINAMLPQPEEAAGAWWGNTGAVDARTAAARACTMSRTPYCAAGPRVSGTNSSRCSANPAASNDGRRSRYA